MATEASEHDEQLPVSAYCMPPIVATKGHLTEHIEFDADGCEVASDG